MKVHKICIDNPTSNLFLKIALQTCNAYVFQILFIIRIVERELLRSEKEIQN